MDRTLFTEQLGLFGWKRLEPILLASLASEFPLLLIGKHGSAKSFLLEALSETLGMEYRFYNASLLNYDDLVGIPIPNKDNSGLTYISGPNSIWDAEIVFIDEINRTKPELQNKLFPIIYQKRVQGIKLDKLRYRWAAMNLASLEGEEDGPMYLGAFPLDPALADRFPFLISVPLWDDLSLEERKRVLDDSKEGKRALSFDLRLYIGKTRERASEIEKSEGSRLTQYILALVEFAEKEVGYISSRRAKMLRETLVYTEAAFDVIGEKLGREDGFDDVAFAHLSATLPVIANKPLEAQTRLNLVRHAKGIAENDNAAERDILLTCDPYMRIVKTAQRIGKVSLRFAAEVVLDSLKDIKKEAMKLAFGVLCYLKFRRYDFAPSEIEVLAGYYRQIMSCRGKALPNDSSTAEINAFLSGVKDDNPLKGDLALLLRALHGKFCDASTLDWFATDFLVYGKEMGLCGR